MKLVWSGQIIVLTDIWGGDSLNRLIALIERKIHLPGESVSKNREAASLTIQ